MPFFRATYDKLYESDWMYENDWYFEYHDFI